MSLRNEWKGCKPAIESSEVTLQAGHRYLLQSAGYPCGLFPLAVWLVDEATGEIVAGQKR